MESTLNSKMDGLQNGLAQKIDHLQYSITRLSNQQQVQEKRKFPTHKQPNPRGIHVIASTSEPTPRMDEVKVDKFYYPIDFVVLDTEPMGEGTNHVPIILGRPFLPTSNAIINCRN